MNNINPKHYKAEGKKECIDEIKDIFGAEAQYGFCVGNCWKYLYRQGEKAIAPAEEDIEKARWYFDYILNTKLYKCIDEKKFNDDFIAISGRFLEVRGYVQKK